jgi:prevent-host-death family protein
MVRMAINKVRDALSDTVDRVAFKGERIILQRHGKDEAALVSVADLKLLEEIEDREDAAAAREALAEPGERRSFDDVRKELGLAK